MKHVVRACVHRAVMLVAAHMLTACASFSIITPAPNSTAIAPVSAEVYWNADLQANSLKVVLDPAGSATDVTHYFTISSLSSGSHATAASVPMGQGTHTLSVEGNLWTWYDRSYDFTSTSQAFTVANGAGRPVTYTLTIFNTSPGWPSGQLGTVSFGGTNPQAANFNVNLIFTFEGNTANVIPYTAPRPCEPNCPNDGIHAGAGFEIVYGSASVTVQDAVSGAVLAQGTFIPGAGIFVSVDNANGGVGFGCKGAPPSDPSFPNHGVEVAYPYAIFAGGTDLKSNFSTSASWALSCAGFNGSPGQRGPGTCNVPISLPTTVGTLTIIANDQQSLPPPNVNGGTFTTTLH